MLEHLISRPDQGELKIRSMVLALQYYHTLEDWESQHRVLTNIPLDKIVCCNGILTIDMKAIDPLFRTLTSDRISIGALEYKKGTVLDACTFTINNGVISLVYPCEGMCDGLCVNIPYAIMPDFKVTCEGVTGSWIYDKYPDSVNEYARQYSRSILDNTRFNWDTDLDIIVLRGELPL